MMSAVEHETLRNYVGSIPGLGNQSTVLQHCLRPTKLAVAGVYLVINIKLQSSSMCSHKSMWIHRDKRKRELVITTIFFGAL